MAADGNTYERRAIEEWLERSGGATVMGERGSGHSPRQSASGRQGLARALQPNYRLREEIHAYRRARKILDDADGPGGPREAVHEKEANKATADRASEGPGNAAEAGLGGWWQWG
mmetsp:Transcript_20357/g.46011  ORF Transcript_20357/g.46011 Transcript_20357/m.46011 type:complete len:115 (+) Transcript_20357:134-478(+)